VVIDIQESTNLTALCKSRPFAITFFIGIIVSMLLFIIIFVENGKLMRHSFRSSAHLQATQLQQVIKINLQKLQILSGVLHNINKNELLLENYVNSIMHSSVFKSIYWIHDYHHKKERYFFDKSSSQTYDVVKDKREFVLKYDYRFYNNEAQLPFQEMFVVVDEEFVKEVASKKNLTKEEAFNWLRDRVMKVGFDIEPLNFGYKKSYRMKSRKSRKVSRRSKKASRKSRKSSRK
jgi:hypothetical protein